MKLLPIILQGSARSGEDILICRSDIADPDLSLVTNSSFTVYSTKNGSPVQATYTSDNDTPIAVEVQADAQTDIRIVGECKAFGFDDELHAQIKYLYANSKSILNIQCSYDVNVANCPNLKIWASGYIPTESLDLNKLTNLEVMYFVYSSMKSIDASNCKNITMVCLALEDLEYLNVGSEQEWAFFPDNNVALPALKEFHLRALHSSVFVVITSIFAQDTPPSGGTFYFPATDPYAAEWKQQILDNTDWSVVLE